MTPNKLVIIVVRMQYRSCLLIDLYINTLWMFELSYCRLIVLFKQLFSHFNTITLNIIICNHNVTIKRYYNLISYFFNSLLATISSLQAPQAQIFAEINNIFSCKIEWSMHYRACRCSTNVTQWNTSLLDIVLINTNVLQMNDFFVDLFYGNKSSQKKIVDCNCFKVD